jgi:hypothetical protein
MGFINQLITGGHHPVDPTNSSFRLVAHLNAGHGGSSAFFQGMGADAAQQVLEKAGLQARTFFRCLDGPWEKRDSWLRTSKNHIKP